MTGVAQDLRQSLENVLYQYSVDVTFWYVQSVGSTSALRREARSCVHKVQSIVRCRDWRKMIILLRSRSTLILRIRRGHDHIYERTCPVFRQICQAPNADGTQSAPMHVVIGNAGYELSWFANPNVRRPCCLHVCAHIWFFMHCGASCQPARSLTLAWRLFGTLPTPCVCWACVISCTAADATC